MRPRTCVLDASAALPFVLPEDNSAAVARIFDQVSSGAVRLVAPSFWLLECGNAIWKHVRRGTLQPTDAFAAMRRLERLPVSTLDSELLIESAFDIAIAFDVTTYDALYAAAALFAKAPLITADRKLVVVIGRGRLGVDVLTPDAW